MQDTAEHGDQPKPPIRVGWLHRKDVSHRPHLTLKKVRSFFRRKKESKIDTREPDILSPVKPVTNFFFKETSDSHDRIELWLAGASLDAATVDGTPGVTDDPSWSIAGSCLDAPSRFSASHNATQQSTLTEGAPGKHMDHMDRFSRSGRSGSSRQCITTAVAREQKGLGAAQEQRPHDPAQLTAALLRKCLTRPATQSESHRSTRAASDDGGTPHSLVRRQQQLERFVLGTGPVSPRSHHASATPRSQSQPSAFHSGPNVITVVSETDSPFSSDVPARFRWRMAHGVGNEEEASKAAGVGDPFDDYTPTARDLFHRTQSEITPSSPSFNTAVQNAVEDLPVSISPTTPTNNGPIFFRMPPTPKGLGAVPAVRVVPCPAGHSSLAGSVGGSTLLPKAGTSPRALAHAGQPPLIPWQWSGGDSGGSTFTNPLASSAGAHVSPPGRPAAGESFYMRLSPTRAVAPTQKQKWSNGLLECCAPPGGCSGCFMALLFPACQYGRLVDLMGSGGPMWGSQGRAASCAHCLLGLACMACTMRQATRRAIRSKYNLEAGSCVLDCAVVSCCAPCALAQEYNEVMARKDAAARAWAPWASQTAEPAVPTVPGGSYTPPSP